MTQPTGKRCGRDAANAGVLRTNGGGQRGQPGKKAGQRADQPRHWYCRWTGRQLWWQHPPHLPSGTCTHNFYEQLTCMSEATEVPHNQRTKMVEDSQQIPAKVGKPKQELIHMSSKARGCMMCPVMKEEVVGLLQTASALQHLNSCMVETAGQPALQPCEDRSQPGQECGAQAGHECCDSHCGAQLQIPPTLQRAPRKLKHFQNNQECSHHERANY